MRTSGTIRIVGLSIAKMEKALETLFANVILIQNDKPLDEEIRFAA